jgi:ACT domain-containing protein
MENVEAIKKTIESMNKYHQIEILKILSKNLCKINENKSGVYINLSFVSKETIDEMKEYIEYIKQQEDSINTMETQKDEFKNAFFTEKDNKEEVSLVYN